MAELPESLRRILEQRHIEKPGIVGCTMRDGGIWRLLPDGTWKKIGQIDPLPEPDDDNPFPP